MLRPTAIYVKAMPDYILKVTFENGETKLFDVKPYIKGEWFGELQDIEVFNTVKVNGYTVEWADGQDLCPDDLYYMSEPINESEAGKDRMETLIGKLLDIPDAYFAFVAGIVCYARKKPERLEKVLRYIDMNDKLTSSDIIKFISDQPDFHEDLVPQEERCNK